MEHWRINISISGLVLVLHAYTTIKKPSCIKRKLDVSRLKCTGIQSELQEKLCELLPALPVDTHTAEHAWTVFRDAVFSAAETALGFCKRKHQDWFDQNDQDILTLIEAKCSAHAAWLSDKNSASKHAHFNNYAGRSKAARGSWRTLGGRIKPLRFRIMQTTSGPRSFMQGSNPFSALFSAQWPRFETRMACSSLTKGISWNNRPFTSVPCWIWPQKWPMKHWSPFSSAPWSQNSMPHLTQQRPMQPSNSCKQARLRDQMEYQPRCSNSVVKLLSLTLPGCSKCSG